MKRILILGGYGQTGCLLARHLLAHSEAAVVLAGRRAERAQALADSLNQKFAGGRATAVRADAGSSADMQAALRGIDLLVVAAPATQHTRIVLQAALDAGADYLDVQLSTEKLGLLRAAGPSIAEAGCCFVTEAGFHPGLPAALVRYAAARMERLDSAMIGAYLNMGSSLPYSEAVNELMEAFRHYQGQVYRQGRWTRPGAYDVRKVDFGGAIGVRRCYSMFFEELRDLPDMIPSLGDLGVYVAETHWVTDYVITPLVLAGLKVAGKRADRPLGRLLWWSMRRFARRPHLVMLHLAATGERAGRPAAMTVSVSHADAYELTAIPVAAFLLQYLDGTARRPGLWLMGHLADPVRLLEDMKRIGVSISP